MTSERRCGEGVIKKVSRGYAYIECDNDMESVFFSLYAVLEDYPCGDLRDYFQNDNIVLFTARKQSPAKNGCEYVATSVIKKEHLIFTYGQITDVFNKFVIVESVHVGRVFVPSSTKNCQNRAWMNVGAARGVLCKVKVMRQPEVNRCQYIALAIAIDDVSTAYEWPVCRKVQVSNRCVVSNRSIRQPESVEDQLGIVVSCKKPSNDFFVFSPQAGLAWLPFNKLGYLVEIGAWLEYDIIKSVTGKCPWKVSRIRNKEPSVPISVKISEQKLIVELDALANRVHVPTSTAWLFNDYIGRIYVDSRCFIPDMKPLDVVHLRAEYTGTFDDVPWWASKLRVIGNDSELRKTCANSLTTADDWQVTHVMEKSPGRFCIFLENDNNEFAFAAWTDVIDIDYAPESGTSCRATVYKQHRDQKYCWRAVMLSFLNDTKSSSSLDISKNCELEMSSISSSSNLVELTCILPSSAECSQSLLHSSSSVNGFSPNKCDHDLVSSTMPVAESGCLVGPFQLDAATQTDELLERALLNDIMKNHNVLLKILEELPAHAHTLFALNYGP